MWIRSLNANSEAVRSTCGLKPVFSSCAREPWCPPPHESPDALAGAEGLDACFISPSARAGASVTAVAAACSRLARSRADKCQESTIGAVNHRVNRVRVASAVCGKWRAAHILSCQASGLGVILTSVRNGSGVLPSRRMECRWAWPRRRGAGPADGEDGRASDGVAAEAHGRRVGGGADGACSKDVSATRRGHSHGLDAAGLPRRF